MKNLGTHIVGALLLSSLPVSAGTFVSKKRIYECQSDKKIMVGRFAKAHNKVIPEYVAQVSDIAGTSARFRAERNYISNNKIKTQILMSAIAQYENSGKYITIQSLEWSIAIAPEKKRASLYHSDPDINEVPMFCLSR